LLSGCDDTTAKFRCCEEYSCCHSGNPQLPGYLSRAATTSTTTIPPRSENTARQEGIINRDSARHSSSTKDVVYCPEHSQSPPEAKTLSCVLQRLHPTSISTETDTKILVTIQCELYYLLRNHSKNSVKKKGHISLCTANTVTRRHMPSKHRWCGA